MSCILKEIAAIQDLPDLTCWLCPHLNNKKNESTNCNETCADADKYAGVETQHGWLDDCLVAVSPTVDLMAIASRNRLAILTNRWERSELREKKSILSVNWTGVVGHSQERDVVTSIVCLPIISQNKSSSGAPDWTCVIVGFQSGFISFYTENGLALLSQKFEEKPVVDISIRTYVPKNFGACIYSDLSEELVILYPKSSISIDGFGLLQMLKACRNQAAKAAAVGGDCSSVASLAYKKWCLSEQEEVTGCVSSGMIPPHLYDHLMLMSNMQGFNQAVSGGVPTTALLLTVGRSPYFASFSVKEGMAQPFMADIAIHYASKLKNALVSAASGWLFGNKTPPESIKREKRRTEQPVHIPFRYTLPDKRRVGLSVQLSSSRRLATVTDDFGRVNVIDVQKCCVLRMFKGYRDAECGWVTIWGDLSDAQREVPFLVIHAPRRSLLEVWLPQQGPRVAAFNVSKGCRLIYTAHTLLGANTQQGRLLPVTPVVLLSSEGILERVAIPFHLALSGKTSRQARDVHLLKTLKGALRSKPPDQILTLVAEMKTVMIKIQLVNTLVNSKYLTVELAEAILVELSTKNTTPDGDNATEVKENEYIDHESRLLSQQLSRLTQLLRLFTFVSSLYSLPTYYDRLSEHEIHTKLSGYLTLSSCDLDELMKNFHDQKCQPSRVKKVKFSEERLSFTSFVQCWEIGSGNVDKEAKVIIPVSLNKKMTPEEMLSLGRFLFGWSCNPDKVRTFAESLVSAGMIDRELLDLIFLYWVSLPEIDALITLHFFHQMLILSVISQPYPTCSNLGEVKPLWQKVRAEITSWNQPLNAFVAILVCRGIESAIVLHTHSISRQVSLEEEQEQTLEGASPAERGPSPLQFIDQLLLAIDASCAHTSLLNMDPSEIWEEFSLELVEWNLLLKKSEKLISVQRLYNILMQRNGANVVPESPDYSIKSLTLKGKGYLSELIAKWYIDSKLPIQDVIQILKEKSISQDDPLETEVPSLPRKDNDPELAAVKEQYQGLKKHFPESTKNDVVLVNFTWECAAKWKKTPNTLSLYHDSIEALKNISNAFFKHGVGCMFWETWIVYYVQSTAQLIEKVSRRPKDRIIQREIGISEFNLERFYTLTKDLLENIMSGSVACEVERPPIVGKDDFWKDVECATSLAEVTVAQKMTSCDLTFLHHQLISVLNLVVKYDLKNVRPFSLFPERERAAFFKPLISSWRFTSHEGREVVCSSQLSFLTRVVSAAVISMPDAKTNDDLETPSGLNDAIEIGRCWGVSLDVIRRHYVCELYSSGLDAMAEQALIMVRDGVIIGSQMVVIAGQRLRHLLTSSPKNIEIMALITPNVKEWCKSLEMGSLRCLDVPIRQTSKMVNRALLLIPGSCREYKTAANLATALDMINKEDLFET